MKNEKTVVAAAIEAVSGEQHEAAKTAGRNWAKKDKLAAEILEDFARTLGTQCTRLQFEALMGDWKEGWIAENPGKTTAAVDKAWQRFKDSLEDTFEIEIIKPASDNPLAEKRKAERDQKKADLLAAYATSGPGEIRQQIEAKYSALAKNPTDKTLKKIVKDLETVLREKTSEESKQRMDALKTLRSEVRAAANKCTEFSALEAALDILNDAADFEYMTEDDQD